MEERTLVKISIDNSNKIHSFLDLTGIENDEEALRFIHSILDEHRQALLDRINKIKTITEIDDFDE